MEAVNVFNVIASEAKSRLKTGPRRAHALLAMTVNGNGEKVWEIFLNRLKMSI